MNEKESGHIPSKIEQESNLRSLLKGLSWRFIGSATTFVLSFLVLSIQTEHTESGKNALIITVVDFLLKLLWYFLHERAWTKWGQNYKYKSIAKTLTWRIIATLDTLVIAVVIDGNLLTAAAIAGPDTLIKMPLYYIHEKIWERVPLGTVRKIVSN